MNDKARSQHIADLFRRTGRLIGNGVPLLSALEARLGEVRENPSMLLIVRHLCHGIEQGLSLTESCRRTGVFSEQLLSALAQAEDQGVLDNRLVSLGDLIERGDFPLSDTEPQPLDEGESGSLKPPFTEKVEALLAEATRVRTSDLHIDPDEQGSRVRFRIDGSLSTRPGRFTRTEHEAVVSYLKCQANCDPAERHLPQEGRITRTMTSADGEEHRIDIRLSICPYFHGEKVVMRFLESYRFPADLSAVMGGDVLTTVHQWLRSPYGMILVTGPTGCGKTTTLYLMIKHLAANEGVNVISLEDPVEYLLDGVNQMMIKPRFGMTFESALRGVLLQDPDVISIGEVRDPETAQLMAKVAMTGHLVLSQLHTKDGIAAVELLLETGVKHYLLSQILRGIVSQRLVRRLCPSCKTPLLPEEQAQLPPPYRTYRTPLYRSAGCEKCSSLGFKGRLAYYEVFEPNHDLWRLVAAGRTEEQLRKSMEGLYKPLLESGRDLVREGLTTWEEVERSAGT